MGFIWYADCGILKSILALLVLNSIYLKSQFATSNYVINHCHKKWLQVKDYFINVLIDV